jgi:hypothetical protein
MNSKPEAREPGHLFARAAAAGLVLSCFTVAAAPGRTVMLDGDDYAVQTQRIELMEKVIWPATALRAHGQETPETRSAYDAAVRQLLELSNRECAPLTGRFKVQERRSIAGGALVRVEAGYRSLWVLQERAR